MLGILHEGGSLPRFLHQEKLLRTQYMTCFPLARLVEGVFSLSIDSTDTVLANVVDIRVHIAVQ